VGELRVASVQVRNVLGIREGAIEPGQVTVFAGANGSSKTSWLGSIQAALGGGSLARLARVPAPGEQDPEAEPEPEVVLVLQGEGLEEYRVERDGEGVRVRRRVGDSAAFDDVGKPQAWLRSLYDPVGSNPVTFLRAADKDRARLLLEALPLTMDRQGLAAALEGVEPSVLPRVPQGLHPLEELGLIRDAVFTARTGVNRDQKGKAQAADQTRRNAPATVPDDPTPAIAAAEQHVTYLAGALAGAEADARADEERALTAAQRFHNERDAGVRSTHKETVRGRRAAFDARAAELRAEVERRIQREKDALEAELDGLREQTEAALDVLDRGLVRDQEQARAARATAERALEATRAELAAAQQRLATLREQAKTSASARALHEQARQFEAEAEQLLAESGRLTAALERIDTLTRRLADSLPIDGLSIEGKVVRRYGVPYEQLNTQQQVDIAVDVAVLRARGQRLAAVWVDGAEALDQEHFDHLVRRLTESGCQAFVARVENHDFQVRVVA